MKRMKLFWTHHVHAIVLILLLLTGLSLYISYFRTLFNKWHIPMVMIHFFIAAFYIFFIFFTIKSVITYVRKRAPLNKFNVGLFITLFFLWFSTGLIMHFQHHFPVTVRNASVAIHDYATWITIPWILVHGIGHLIKQKIPWPNWWRGRQIPPDWIMDNRIGRREAVQSIGLFIIFIFVGGWIKWLTPILSITEKEKKKSGYFRIYNVTNDYPLYEENEWSLTIIDLNQNSKSLTMKDMRGYKWHSIVDDFHCVTGWSVLNIELRGIYVKEILKRHVTELPQDTFITAYSGDGIYYDSFTVAQLMDEDAMLVFELDGQPLKKSQGYPCRLYHPQMYGYKSVKWLTKLQVMNEREKGYWQMNGDYDLNGYI